MLHQCTIQVQLGNLLLATASKLLLWGKLFLCLKGQLCHDALDLLLTGTAGLPARFWRQQDRQSPDLSSEISFLHHKECRELPSSL